MTRPRRGRRWPAVILTIIVLAGLGTSGCGGTTSATEHAAVTPSPSGVVGPSGGEPRIPDGTYRAVILRTAVQKSGYPPALIDTTFGARRQLVVTLKVAGTNFAQFLAQDGGDDELADVGTFSYAGDAVIMRSESVGCSSCTYRARWQMTGSRLTVMITDVLFDTGTAGGDDVKIMNNLTYTRMA